MYLEKQVIGIDLAKRLKALGMKQESLFYWVRMTTADENIEGYGLTYLLNIFAPKESFKEIFSAYTSSELSAFMPHSYIKDDYAHFIDTTSCTMPDGEYFTICRSHFYLDADDGCAVVGDDFDGHGNEADARAQMLIHLIENKLIEKK